MRSVFILSILISGISFAGDSSIHKKDARAFSKMFSGCLRAKDKKCLAEYIDTTVFIDEDSFGCSGSGARLLKSDEFIDCIFKPKGAKIQLSMVLLDCLGPKTEYSDELTALHGKKGFWCYLSGDMDDIKFSQITKKFGREK